MISLRLAAVAAFSLLVLVVASPAHPAVPMRIVSLAPSVTETLFALNAGPSVVGVSDYCDYPPEVRSLPRVGSFLTPNLEAIIAARPTLVIGLGLSSDIRQIRALKSMGYPVLLVRDGSLEEIDDSIEAVGTRIGRESEAHQLVARIRAQIAAVRERLSTVKSERALMLVGHQPMVAVGRGTYLDELLRIAHAENIAAPANEEWPHLSMEYIIAMRPEVILDGSMGNDPSSSSTFWEKYPTIPAVREHRVFGYPENPILHSGPRVGQSLETIARMIHPEAWRDASGAIK
ncbi:MAG TPA: cobalamin-binding protein [Methylomirabilota bacterium]|nr:cobalamin-binding protein [Methylomirabilota bacterium]